MIIPYRTLKPVSSASLSFTTQTRRSSMIGMQINLSFLPAEESQGCAQVASYIR